MSPSSGNDPRTPDRRSSSSALLGAFRSLTSGRLKSPTPPASVSSATGTPVRSGSIVSYQRPDSIASAPPTTTEHTVKQPLQHNVLGGKRAPMGGPSEFEELVALLHVSQPFAERAAAVHKICEVLKEYPVRNVMGLWAAASDLMLPEQSEESAEVGYTLLRSCVALEELNAVERNVFFSAANLRQSDRRFDLRLDIISTLTNGGRNVEACESLLAPFILGSIDDCFQETRNALNTVRKPQSKKNADNSVKESENFAKLFQFVIDVCKFNSKIFAEDDLEQLLHKAIGICQGTTQQSDIENVIRLFDTIITYVHVPSRSLKPCLEVFCIIHRQIEELQEQTWNTLSNLFKSHVGQAAVSALLHTLLDGANRRSRKFSAYRATIQVLQRLLLEDGRNGLPLVPISLLFPALKASIREEHKTQEGFVISLIAAVLNDERTRTLLLNEGDWSDLIEIIRICAGRDDEREAALAVATAERLAEERSASIAGTGSHTAGTTGGAMSATSATGEPEADIIPNGESTSAPSSKHDISRRSSEDDIANILVALNALSSDIDTVHKASIMDLFSGHFDRLTDSVAEDTITYHIGERTFYPSNPDWLEACRRLVSGILKDASRPRSLRILTIKTLRDIHNTVENICPGDVVLQCSALLLNNIEAEEDVGVLNELVDFAVDAADRSSDDSFPDLAELLKRRLEQPKAASLTQTTSHTPWVTNPTCLNSHDQSLGSASNVIATAFVRLFIRSVTKSARKTRLLYEILRYIVGSDSCDVDARLTAMKLLFRLRADSNHAITVNPSSEGESIAAVLCRTEESAVHVDKSDAISIEHGKIDEQNSWREQRKASGSSPHSSLNRYTGRQGSTPGRVSKPVPPLWMYPGPKGLPEEPSTQTSRVVFAHIDQEYYPLSDDIHDMEITLWLELIISLMQNAPDWEIYSYVLVHLGPQLSNQALVRSCVPQLKMLRNVTCEQIRASTFQEPPSHTLLKKADVAVCMFHILTMLISYHDYFEKSEEDDLVKAFLHGIGHWDRTSVWCIHALTVCCHEMPLSMSKSLDNIIQKMSQIITKPSTAIHILEFLTSLGRMPELLKNFREEDFKMVFGVSFNYLRYVRDQRERAASVTTSHLAHRSVRHTGPVRDATASPDHAPGPRKAKLAEEDLPQYVYSLAYHVITFWFMALKMDDRPKLMPWITRNLQYTDNSGKQVMEEQAQVILDMMSMSAYSDRDDTARDPDFSEPGDGEVWKKTWIVGHCLLTIETAARTGVSLTTSRRPCGTRHIYSKPLLTNPPRHQVPITIGLAYEAWDTASYVGLLPDDLFNTYYAPLHLLDPPIVLPDDQMVRRAIDTFDRNSTVDGYGVGVVYIGDGQMGQTHEKAILLNDNGSAAYTSFLGDLGTLVRLKGAKINTHGLDVRNDNDGEYTFCWRDRCMELVFHIPTMMPTPDNSDEIYASKKRHIGNDYVNIIFNDSGLSYDFNTFPSAFNYVAIVIAPEARASFVDRRLDSDPDGKNRYYKVQVISKPGFPDISPAVEPKIICGKHLAAYCRLLAINASVFSQVWSQADGGESISSWRNRLRQIKTLRERYGQSDASAAALPSSPVNSHTLSTPPSRDNGAGFKRASAATFMSEGTNRSSVTSGSHDVAL